MSCIDDAMAGSILVAQKGYRLLAALGPALDLGQI
jgi:hypothetical protein